MVHMKIAMVSTIEPHGHYTENLCKALATEKSLHITLYTPIGEHSVHLPRTITQKAVWRKGWWFALDILKAVRHDKPDIVHLQHEFTMYGGVVTALLFPLLVILLRINGYPVITTLHAVVAKKQIDTQFIHNFLIRQPLYIRPGSMKVVFTYIYTTIGRYTSACVCHTKLLAQTLIDDYYAAPHRVYAIAPVVPHHTLLDIPKKPYFFYYGYMVRRKGLEYIFEAMQKLIQIHPSYQLVLAGGQIPGQEAAYEELLEKIKELGIQDHVEIKGFIETEQELDTLYAEAYAVLIPARLSIAASGPLYHARGYHKCIAASRIGNFIEEVQHNTNGILVENDKWYDALVYMVEHPEIVAQLANGSAAVAEKHSGHHIADKYTKLYNHFEKH